MLWVFIAPFVLPFSLVVGKAIGGELPVSLVVGKAIGETIDIVSQSATSALGAVEAIASDIASDFNAARDARSGCSSECVFPFTYRGGPTTGAPCT